MFAASIGRAITKDKVVQETIKVLDKFGAPFNIKRWYAWTPIQLNLMANAVDLKKVVLSGGNGVGKWKDYSSQGSFN